MAIINNPNQQEGFDWSNLIGLLGMMGGQGEGDNNLNTLLSLMQSMQTPEFDPTQLLQDPGQNPWDKDEWSHLPPGAL